MNKPRIVSGCILTLMISALTGCGLFRTAESPLQYAGYRPDISRVSAGGSGSVDPLKIGDSVAIKIRNAVEEKLIEDIIDGKGMISLPEIPDIRIAGLTASQAEKFIAELYVDKQIYKSVLVTLLTTRTSQDVFYIGGCILRPGQHPLTEAMTLSNAILASGDFTEWANTKKIRVISGSNSTTYNVSKIRDGKEPDPIIKPGDSIYVER